MEVCVLMWWLECLYLFRCVWQCNKKKHLFYLNFSGFYAKTYIQHNIHTSKSFKVTEVKLDTIQIYEKLITLISVETVLMRYSNGVPSSYVIICFTLFTCSSLPCTWEEIYVVQSSHGLHLQCVKVHNMVVENWIHKRKVKTWNTWH
jgi:hypothetical protein